jgi:hypothetical protein
MPDESPSKPWRNAHRTLPLSLTYRGKRRDVIAHLVQEERDGELVPLLQFRLAGCQRRLELHLPSLFWTAMEKDDRKRSATRKAREGAAPAEPSSTILIQ